MKLMNRLSFFNQEVSKEISIYRNGSMYYVKFCFIEDFEQKTITNETYYEYENAYKRFLDIKDQWFTL